MPMTDTEVSVWRNYWRDLAKLHIWAYHEFASVTEELDLPKIRIADQREMVTSTTIETWRQVGRGRSPLPGWVMALPPMPIANPKDKNGALELINAMQPERYENSSDFIKNWLTYVTAATKSIEHWKHAGSIAGKLGLDSGVLYSEHDPDHLMLITQAIWTYASIRDEDESRNTALNAVAKEYDLPTELMQFEEEEEVVTDDDLAF